MVYFHFPILSPVSLTAAEYAECAGEQGSERYWDFLDTVYRNQRNLSERSLEELATKMDLEASAMFECVDSGRHDATWKADRAYGHSLEVRATPTIFIAYVDESGEEVRLQFRGARSYDEFSETFDTILREIEQ